MSEPKSAGVPLPRSDAWKWYVCVLLLFATVVNYMDRLTTNNLAVEIQQQFTLNDEQYGNLELGFGLAFATGSLLFGALVDRIGVFWLYPIVLVGWSGMGFLTGLSRSYEELLLLRVMLGLFEAGHFPCGLKTVQLLLEPRDRAMGNSLLQSGTAVGAILAPIVIKLLASEAEGGWRPPFLVIGAGGCIWVLFWLVSVRPRDLRAAAQREAARREAAASQGVASGTSYWGVVLTPKFLSLMIVVTFINLNWHLFRVWLPKYMREIRGFSLDEMLNFNMLYYFAADIGVMSAGAAAAWLVRHGQTVYASRMWVFAACALATTTTTAVPFLPVGPMLIAALLVIAFGALGCFAPYYSLTQDLSTKHQGKVSGTLATCTWLITAGFHKFFGRYLDQTNNYELAIGVMGWLPMLALVSVLVLWNRGAGQAVPASEPSSDWVPEPVPVAAGGEAVA